MTADLSKMSSEIFCTLINGLHRYIQQRPVHYSENYESIYHGRDIISYGIVTYYITS